MNCMTEKEESLFKNVVNKKSFKDESFSVRQAKIENAYGAAQGNWGDLPIFQGDYINFGYWKDIVIGKEITKEDRVRSSAALYAYVIKNLNVSGDTVLELGCGRGVGMLDGLEYMNVSKIIGIDISGIQISRAETKKGKRKNQNFIEKLKAEKIKRDLDSLEKQFELVLDNIQYNKREFEQEIDSISGEIDKLQRGGVYRALKEKIAVFKNNIDKDTDLEVAKQELKKSLQENKIEIEKTIEVKTEIARKIDATTLQIASADLTGLQSNSVDKIYSIEVFQHIEDFDTLAAEISRILAPNGCVSFCAHLATNSYGYKQIKEQNLIIDEIEFCNNHVGEVVRSFKNHGFNVSYHSIGEHVFAGYDQWVMQSSPEDVLSHAVYSSYKNGYIDYYVFVMNKVSGGVMPNGLENDANEL